MNSLLVATLVVSLAILIVVLIKLGKNKHPSEEPYRWGSGRMNRRPSRNTYDPSYCVEGTDSCIKKCVDSVECKIECLESCPKQAKEDWRGWGWRRPWGWRAGWGWGRPWGWDTVPVVPPCQARAECKRGCNTGCDNTTKSGTKEHQKCVHECSESCDEEFPC